MAEIEFLDEGNQAVDSERAAPHGTPCVACGCPVESQDRFCPACGTPHDPEPVVTAQVIPGAAQQAGPVAATVVEINEENDVTRSKHFRCENCGSEMATDPDQRSYVCPFCDSTYVVEFAPEHTGRQRPEFIIGFAITPDQAKEKFGKWIQENAWFRPGDLAKDAVAEKQKGVYLPFWSFSMLATSRWQATIGEYWYRTETYTTTDSKGKTVTRTRRVRETEWWPLEGNHHHYYAGFLVSGSTGLSQQDAERIKPFQLPALKRYEPYYLAGWLSEEYSVPRDRALQTCQQEFYRREQHNVGAFLPGDTHRQLHVSTTFSNVNSDLCLLPVYILSYRYKDQLYRFLVNGQTGKVTGDKPTSKTRVGVAVGVLVAILLLIVALIVLVASFS